MRSAAAFDCGTINVVHADIRKIRHPQSREPSMRFPALQPVFALAGALIVVPPVQSQGSALVLTHATVIDGSGAPPRSGMTLVLRDGRIAAIYPDGSQPSP